MTPATTGLLLTPGASADRNSSALVAIDKALAAHGVLVERVDLPASRPGPKVFDTIRDAAARLAGRADQVVLGGRSFGGRMCSVVVAEGLPAAGLVLVSYPLHPPGRPENRRTEHLPQLTVPCLFVSGTRDPFATPAELEEASAAIPGPVTHAWIDGGGHGLRGKDRAVAEVVRDWVLALSGPPD
jgi:predicted alpha/beta-hydrolase family hydrolase